MTVRCGAESIRTPMEPPDVPADEASEQREARRLDDLLEAERRWLARDLRDDLGQELTAARLEVEALGALARGGALSLGVRRVAEAIERSHASVRFIADSLRPRIVDEEGIGAALRWLARQLTERTGRACEAHVSLASEPDDAVSLAVFRIVQEALAEVAPDARGAPVAVTLRGDADALTLTVVDPAARAGGVIRRPTLVGMGERAAAVGGALRVAVAPTETRVVAHFAAPRDATRTEVRP